MAWYFTFGCGHILKNHIIKVNIDDYEKAREHMVDSFGTKWCCQYPEKKALELISKYGYIIIEGGE